MTKGSVGDPSPQLMKPVNVSGPGSVMVPLTVVLKPVKTGFGKAVAVTVGGRLSMATLAESSSVAFVPPASSSSAMTVTVSVSDVGPSPLTERTKVQVTFSPGAIQSVVGLNAVVSLRTHVTVGE